MTENDDDDLTETSFKEYFEENKEEVVVGDEIDLDALLLDNQKDFIEEEPEPIKRTFEN